MTLRADQNKVWAEFPSMQEVGSGGSEIVTCYTSAFEQEQANSYPLVPGLGAGKDPTFFVIYPFKGGCCLTPTLLLYRGGPGWNGPGTTPSLLLYIVLGYQIVWKLCPYMC